MRVDVSSPSVLPLAVARRKGYEYAVGLTLEQPRLRLRYVNGELSVEKKVPGELLGGEVEAIARGIIEELEAGEIPGIAAVAVARLPGGWRTGLSAAAFSYGGLLLTVSRRDRHRVVSRIHVDEEARIVLLQPPCPGEARPLPLAALMEAQAMAALDDGGLERVLRILGRAAATRHEFQCREAEKLYELVSRLSAVAGVTPTGIIYSVPKPYVVRERVKRGVCLIVQAADILGVPHGLVVNTTPQNTGARIIVERDGDARSP